MLAVVRGELGDVGRDRLRVQLALDDEARDLRHGRVEEGEGDELDEGLDRVVAGLVREEPRLHGGRGVRDERSVEVGEGGEVAVRLRVEEGEPPGALELRRRRGRGHLVDHRGHDQAPALARVGAELGGDPAPPALAQHVDALDAAQLPDEADDAPHRLDLARQRHGGALGRVRALAGALEIDGVRVEPVLRHDGAAVEAVDGDVVEAARRGRARQHHHRAPAVRAREEGLRHVQRSAVGDRDLVIDPGDRIAAAAVVGPGGRGDRDGRGHQGEGREVSEGNERKGLSGTQAHRSSSVGEGAMNRD